VTGLPTTTVMAVEDRAEPTKELTVQSASTETAIFENRRLSTPFKTAYKSRLWLPTWVSSGSKLIVAVVPVAVTEPMTTSVKVPVLRNTNDEGVKKPH